VSDWKDVAISDLIALQSQKKRVTQERAEDEDILNASLLMKKAVDKITELEQPYNNKLLEITTHIERLQENFADKWDIADKKYKCDIGEAILRTTKALKIDNKPSLVTLLLKIGKLPECIRSWNLTYLRKLKDAGLIDDMIAHYDENQNVIVKEVAKK
jgi:hypothetical protein